MTLSNKDINKDIKFIRLCKKEHLSYTYLCKGETSSKIRKCQQKLARIMMETEMKHKHREKRKKRREIVKLSMDLKDLPELILFSVVMYRLDRSLKLKSNVVSQCHIKKLSELHNQTKSASVEIQQSLLAKQFITFHHTISQRKKKKPYLLVWENISQQVWIVINFLQSLKYFIKTF